MMNKEKILNQLMDIRELTGGADSPSENLEDDLMEIRNISSKAIKEINSKPVMPKAFDEWFKEPRGNEYMKIFYLSRFLSNWVTYNSNETDIREWVYADPHRFTMCIEAILYGYEVEK